MDFSVQSRRDALIESLGKVKLDDTCKKQLKSWVSIKIPSTSDLNLKEGIPYNIAKTAESLLGFPDLKAVEKVDDKTTRYGYEILHSVRATCDYMLLRMEWKIEGAPKEIHIHSDTWLYVPETQVSLLKYQTAGGERKAVLETGGFLKKPEIAGGKWTMKASAHRDDILKRRYSEHGFVKVCESASEVGLVSPVMIMNGQTALQVNNLFVPFDKVVQGHDPLVSGKSFALGGPTDRSFCGINRRDVWMAVEIIRFMFADLESANLSKQAH